jgi:hypothetical protein
MANSETTPKYTILRSDLFADIKALEATLADYKEKGLDVQEEIKKLVNLGYIKVN